jgi:DNA-directed RNA polymerase specialized sigma24 family protein
MEDNGIFGPSPFDSDADESPEMLYAVVMTIVNGEHPDPIGPVGCDDMAHEVFLKVWLYQQTRPIYSLKPFIRRVLSNVRVDMQRKFKPSLYQEFPRDEFGEVREDLLRSLVANGESDLEQIVIDGEQYAARVKQFANAVAELPPRQQTATACTLKNRLDDWQSMTTALEARGVNPDQEWPADLNEKRCLQASFSPAKLRIARSIGEDKRAR